MANAQIHAMIADDYYDGRTADAAIFFQDTSSTLLNQNLILLDSCSSHHQFCNPNIVKNIRHSNHPIMVHCNAGTKVTTQEADFGSIAVYFNPASIANVLSLGKLRKDGYKVGYDDDEGAFVVTTHLGQVIFRDIGNHLHCADIADLPAAAAAMFVNTVAQNYEGYTKREVLKAHEARRFQRMIGAPSERDYQGLVREKLIANCPVTVTDVHNAHQLFGPDLANLRGKTVRRSPEHVAVDYIDLPLSFLDRHRNVTVTADIMFVNGLPFLITLSRAINLVTIEFASTRTAANLTKLLTRVVDVYAAAGFKVQTVLMDMEFQCLQPLMPQIIVNTTAANEHVAEIERRIRVVKERARGIINTLPYPRLPKRMIVELMHFVTMWLNSFPVKGGISQKYSPRELITRRRLDAKLHCKAEFGAYCEVHDEPSPSNTMQRRTHPSICLGPTGNLQGSYKFFCLTTGQLLT